MSKHWLCVSVAAVVLLAACPVAQAQKASTGLKTVKVLGFGMTKKEALRDALRKAVEKGAGVFIHSQSKTKNFVLVRDTILTRSAGFVQSHRVISKREMEDGTWELTVTAVVSVKGVRDVWGTVTILLKQMGRPKIMVFINEKIGRKTVATSTVQTRIENLLLKSGFKLVNKDQLKAIDKKDITDAAAEDNPEKIRAIAKRFGAQLYITGSANAAAGVRKNIGGILLYTYEAEANIKCYRSDTAGMLSAIPGVATRGVQRVANSAAKQALDYQARQIAPMVRRDILKSWQAVLEGRGEVQLHVSGITFKQSVKLEEALKTVKQITDVTVDFRNKVAECTLQSDLNAKALAKKLIKVIDNLEITDVSQNVIKATLSK